MRNHDSQIKIFAGSASVPFTNQICNFLGIAPGKSQVIRFSDGNIFVQVQEKVRDNDVYIVQTIGLDPNNEFMELLFWVDAFRRSSAGSITAIIPYLGYSKGDKKDQPRVSIRARVCADCLEVNGVDRIVTMDLHSPQIQGFFKKPVDHLYGLPIICEYIQSRNFQDLVIVSPDAGFAKNARAFSDYLKTPVAIGNKTRKDHNEKAEVLNILGDVKGKTAVIVDDFTISCGTLVECASKLKEMGAAKIYAAVTHALIREKGVKLLESSCIEELVVTDTIENQFAKNCAKVRVLSASELFAKALQIIHARESLTQLFPI